jgi:hypothetical protein
MIASSMTKTKVRKLNASSDPFKRAEIQKAEARRLHQKNTINSQLASESLDNEVPVNAI